MSINYNTQRRIFTGLKNGIIEIFYNARMNYIDYNSILNSLYKYKNQTQWNKLTRKDQGELEGYVNCNFHRIDTEEIIWCHFHPVYGFNTIEEFRLIEDETKYQKIISCLSTYFWKKPKENNSMKPYHIHDFSNPEQEQIEALNNLQKDRLKEFKARRNEITPKQMEFLISIFPFLANIKED